MKRASLFTTAAALAHAKHAKPPSEAAEEPAEPPPTQEAAEPPLTAPHLNWEAREGAFTAARALATPHGMAHVQRCGLQRATKHGVFHYPRRERREGWRVALTARITKPDAAGRVANFVVEGAYSEQIGPEGKWQLPGTEAAAEEAASGEGE